MILQSKAESPLDISPPSNDVSWFDKASPEVPLKERRVSRLSFQSIETDPTSTAAKQMDVPAAEVPEHIEIDLENVLSETDQVDETALIESARSEARQEAEREYQADLNRRITEEQARFAQIQTTFQQKARRYFADVEHEVVKLALAIAARILNREVNVDPLLLAGVVRVAMEKIGSESVVTLRVPPSELPQWQQLLPDLRRPGVVVIGDENMDQGGCLIETSVGRVDLGIKAQLEEIERGFCELMQRRPD